jgi:hypothetical protein
VEKEGKTIAKCRYGNKQKHQTEKGNSEEDGSYRMEHKGKLNIYYINTKL